MKCGVCGNELEDRVMFCPNCGSKAELEDAIVKDDNVSESTTEDMTTAGVAEVISNAEPECVIDEDTEAAAKLYMQDSPVTEELENGQEDSGTPAFMPVQEKWQQEVQAPEIGIDLHQGAEKEYSKTKKELKKDKHDAKKAEKLRIKRQYVIEKNPLAVTVFAVLLAVLLTGAMFASVSIFILSHSNFDAFYNEVIFTDIIKNIDFWVLTSSWYAIAVYTIFLLVVLLVFAVLKRRRYAMLNYIGIPTLINGVVFLIIGYFSRRLIELFALDGVIRELFMVIDEAVNSRLVVSYALLLLVIGASAVIVYAITAAIHKAVYRRKCRKAEKYN